MAYGATLGALAAAPTSRRHSFLRAAFEVWRRDAVAYRKYARSSFIINFGDPFIGLVAIGLGLGTYVTLGHHVSLISFIAPGLVASSAMMAARAGRLLA
jgi:lipooligosaccharide transport system permease protein